MRVLVVCFANTCRSPVAEALLVAQLHSQNVAIQSRGLAGGTGVLPEPLRHVLDQRGISLSSDTGAALTKPDAREADLVLFVERRLLREAVVTDPTIWPKSFTMREFARRAMIDPPEPSSESFGQWLAVLHGKRHREELLGTDEMDDVKDPGLDGDEAEFNQMVDELTIDVNRITPFLSGWPSSAA
jgi:protein-tyrosine phosphatase